MGAYTVLDCFSGYGGFGLGLRLAYPDSDFRTVAYIEWDKFCQRVIQARIADGHLDDAPIWDDIKSFDGKPWRGVVDILSAGFPCQPHSSAGLRKGADDDRNLWPDTLRIIREVAPRHVLLENVPGILVGGDGRPPYGGTVVGELAEAGYDAKWRVVSAADAGAPHLRNRWWLLAYSVARDSGGHTITPNYPEGFNTNLVTEVEKERRQRLTPGRPTSETGGGSWPVRWNRPNTMDSLSAKSQQALEPRGRRGTEGKTTGGFNDLKKAVGMFPTPRADESYQGDGAAEAYAEAGFKQPKIRNGMVRASSTFDTTLTTAVKAQQMLPTPRAGKTTDEDEESWLARMFPTPTSRDHKDGDAHSCQNVPVNGLLGREVHLLPTPSSGGDSGGPHGIRGGSWAKEKLVETFGEEDSAAMSDGSLSPDWVSWLMGLPVGWTSLEPLPQEEYDQWFQSQMDGTWWQEEQGLPRVTSGIPDRVNRLKCLGNGIVPASLAVFLRGG